MQATHNKAFYSRDTLHLESANSSRHSGQPDALRASRSPRASPTHSLHTRHEVAYKQAPTQSLQMSPEQSPFSESYEIPRHNLYTHEAMDCFQYVPPKEDFVDPTVIERYQLRFSTLPGGSMSLPNGPGQANLTYAFERRSHERDLFLYFSRPQRPPAFSPRQLLHQDKAAARPSQFSESKFRPDIETGSSSP